jgi:Yip1 domain
MRVMKLIDRVRGILLAPKTEWPKVAAEPATTQSIIVGYVLILAAIGPVVLLLRGFGLLSMFAMTTYLISVGVTLVLAWIVDALAPSFGGEKNYVSALKLTAYSYTAAWLAGIAYLLPVFAMIAMLAASIYSFYTFFLGAPVLRKCAPEKAVGFTIVVAVCGVVLGAVLGSVMGSMLGGMTAAQLSGFGSMH